MKEKILKLRGEGKTYNEIKELLGCSKGTISYHCGEGQKEKWRIRQRRNRKKVNAIIRDKIDSYLRPKIHNFKRGRARKKTTGKFDYKSAYLKIFNNPKCYLTGRKIELENSRSYHLDHITAFSKGGKNDLNNLGLACREANIGKGNMSIDEFIRMCVDVCRHNGYEVKKI